MEHEMSNGFLLNPREIKNQKILRYYILEIEKG